MQLFFERFHFQDSYINICNQAHISLGFTENQFKPEYLTKYFPFSQIIEVKQIHSNQIWFSRQIKPGKSGDGIILESKNIVAIIKTADCVPLFFWEENPGCAGIIHVGWRGMQKKIERILLNKLSKKNWNPKNFLFFIGPAIDQKCYPVGCEVFNSFRNHFYRDLVFSKSSSGKYFLDIKKAIRISLQNSGISPEKILDAHICTFCEKNRFPSYRREKELSNRIYNFIILR